ncbi:hypothetical protein TNIN_274001 [Trichonephila inaurata madagascariensis]|uniref:Uncharacterized protein n=1 Tax=Trichonephila inaurata madagascariensis TaxID=2747483 RepID=A0A8X7BYH3_9ARAC|nr:hypothetical protein TNIN_274001 [Trichonephila inaurata madagascariensis]
MFAGLDADLPSVLKEEIQRFILQADSLCGKHGWVRYSKTPSGNSLNLFEESINCPHSLSFEKTPPEVKEVF